MQVTEKRIIIVGGSSGIGLCLCQKLRGDIINISRSPCPIAGVKNIQADVTDRTAIERAFKTVERADALIYCAGTSMAAPVEYVKKADYEKLFSTNLFGAIECAKFAMPVLRKSGDGRMVFLSSSGGVTPIPFDSFYSASKAALTMFAQCLTLETAEVKATAAIIPATKTQFSFKRKIYDGCADYDTNLKSAADALIKIEQTGYDPNKVADGIIKILNSKNPPYKKTIGGENKFLLGLYAILPKCIRQALIKRIYRLHY